MPTQLAWIGLGNIGRGMCANLARHLPQTSSLPLLIHNRTVSRCEELRARLPPSSVIVAPTLAQAVAESNIIFTCLADDAAVLSAITTVGEERGFFHDKLFVDCSTVHPDTTAKLAALIAEKGGNFVACPVFGAPAMADAGKLVVVLAGATEDVARVKPYLDNVVARATIDLSPRPPSQATLLKIIGNTFILSMIAQLAESHVLAEKSGLGLEALQQFIGLVFPGPYEAYSQRMSTGDYWRRKEPLFGVPLATKDAGHALELAERNGVTLNMVETAVGYLKEVQEGGDVAGMYGAARARAGLKFENGDGGVKLDGGSH